MLRIKRDKATVAGKGVTTGSSTSESETATGQLLNKLFVETGKGVVTVLLVPDMRCIKH